MRTLFATCFALSLACTAASAQDRVRPAPRPRTEVNAPDPFARLRVNGRVMVGDQAPDFALTSSTGNDVALSSMRGDWLLLRFAADRKELAELAPMKSELDQMGVRLLVISGDKPQTLRAFIQRTHMPFEVLSDATGEVSAVYGFYDPITLASRTGVVIVDRRGIVRMALQGGAPADQVVELARYTVSAFTPRP